MESVDAAGWSADKPYPFEQNHRHRLQGCPGFCGVNRWVHTEFYRMAIERAKELGRNVARAMDRPIEEVKYLGEEAAVSCPLCHSNVLLVPEACHILVVRYAGYEGLLPLITAR